MPISVPRVDPGQGGGSPDIGGNAAQFGAAVSDEIVTIFGPAVVLSGPAELAPPYVSKIELDVKGNTETLTDQCGHTEVRKNGDSNWTFTVEGIISAREVGAFKTLSRTNQVITVTSELYTGIVICDSTIITQKDELNAVEFPGKGYDGNESAFTFQMIFKQPISKGGGGVIPNFS